MISRSELIPGHYYRATYKNSRSDNVYTVIATNNEFTNVITLNGKKSDKSVSGTLYGADDIVEISEEEAVSGKRKLSNKEASKFLEKEW